MRGRSAAARSRQEAADRLASLRMPKRPRMSRCPVCEQPIYSNQKTKWRSVDGVAARVHESHTT